MMLRFYRSFVNLSEVKGCATQDRPHGSTPLTMTAFAQK